MAPEVMAAASSPIQYPESDGKPMAENTEQFHWITMLAGNIEAMYAEDPNVFVGGDLLWYPLQGDADTRYAPDVFVVFGRPKGRRGSYRQWEENDIPMTVVFEVWSPRNTVEEMGEKLAAYDEWGVQEYYVLNPDTNQLIAYRRGQATLVMQRFGRQYVSPRLGIRFEVSEDKIEVFYPDGRPFRTMAENERRAVNAEKDAVEARERADRADKALLEAKEQVEKADKERLEARELAAKAKKDVTTLQERMARMRGLTVKSLRNQATPAELEELEALLQTDI